MYRGSSGIMEGRAISGGYGVAAKNKTSKRRPSTLLRYCAEISLDTCCWSDEMK